MDFIDSSGSKTLVFIDQRAVLAEVGLRFDDDAPLRPLVTLGTRDKQTLIVLITPPDVGPEIAAVAPWLDASSSLIAHLEQMS